MHVKASFLVMAGQLT